jgi:ribonuclease P protein subunit RPR2
MVRIARERISVLFVLAEQEAAAGRGTLAHRYVTLARRVGTRYNVRLLPEYRELYCRGCSEFWVEGRTVRTRLRGGRRVRTCLTCGRERRVLLRPPHESAGRRPDPGAERAPREDAAVLLAGTEDAPSEESGEGAEEE